MRVVFLTGSARQADGTGNALGEKVAFFAERSADVRVYCDDDRLIHPGVAAFCRRLDVDGISDQDRQFLASADLVIVEFGHAHSLLRLLPELARWHRRVLFDYHGVTPAELWPAERRHEIETALHLRRLVWCADFALCHSRFTEHELLEATGFPKERSGVLGHPVDAQRFRPGKPACDLRDRLGLGDVRLLLFIGRLAPSKRVGVLIEALARLRAPSVHLAIIGDQGDLYALEAARCRILADHLGVKDRVHFLGRIPDRDLPDAYRCADLFVMPSRHEGFCLPVVEAMASGLPVVASRAGALPETVGAGGLLFSPDDADELVQRCRTLLIEDPALHCTLRQRAPVEAARHARPDWRQRFAELIEHVLDSSPRRHREAIRLSLLPGQQAAWRDRQGIAATVRVTNDGTHAVWSEALASPVIRAEIEPASQASGQPATFSLPWLLCPQETRTLVLSLPASETLRNCQVKLSVVSRSAPSENQLDTDETGSITLQVLDKAKSSLRAALAEAQRVHVLPLGYRDVSTGPFAFVKRWLKSKLLGSFQRSYVDVLSQRQTAFNREILSVLAELTALSDERQADSDRLKPDSVQDVLDQLDSIVSRVSVLEERLTQLERVGSGDPS